MNVRIATERLTSVAGIVLIAAAARSTGSALRIALITLLSVAALAMLILPHGELKLEPKHFPSPAEIKALATGDACPVCDGKSRLKCRICINGRIYYMGTSAVCSHCAGQGWIVCVICRGTSKLRES